MSNIAKVATVKKATNGPLVRWGGQWLPYLQYSLQDFMAGQRTAPDGMMNALKTLSPGEQEAILNYAASLR